MIIGIDNGIDGGLCAISRSHGKIIAKRVMPILKRNGKSEVDVLALRDWILALHTEPCIVIEEPLRHAKSSQAMRSMAMNFGKILGACEMKGWQTVPVEVHQWQKNMLVGSKGKGTKAAALTVAERLSPGEDWTKSDKATIPHDGMIDAYLIACYWRKQK
jgi:hypothetical protein